MLLRSMSGLSGSRLRDATRLPHTYIPCSAQLPIVSLTLLFRVPGSCVPLDCSTRFTTSHDFTTLHTGPVPDFCSTSLLISRDNNTNASRGCQHHTFRFDRVDRWINTSAM